MSDDLGMAVLATHMLDWGKGQTAMVRDERETARDQKHR